MAGPVLVAGDVRCGEPPRSVLPERLLRSFRRQQCRRPGVCGSAGRLALEAPRAEAVERSAGPWNQLTDEPLRRVDWMEARRSSRAFLLASWARRMQWPKQPLPPKI